MTLRWARQSPTKMVMGVHNLGDLRDLESSLSRLCGVHNLPFAAFREDERSLGGILTAVGALIPDSIFGHKPAARASDSERWATEPEAGRVFEYPFPHADVLGSAAIDELSEIILTAKFAGK